VPWLEKMTGFRSATQTQHVEVHVPAVPGSSGDDREDVLAKIERLGGLRDQGLISAEEFEEKKRELLDRL
jgi:putative oligomerization/nucleic acid binding protein